MANAQFFTETTYIQISTKQFFFLPPYSPLSSATGWLRNWSASGSVASLNETTHVVQEWDCHVNMKKPAYDLGSIHCVIGDHNVIPPSWRVGCIDLWLASLAARVNWSDVESVGMETAIPHVPKKLKLRVPILRVLSIAILEMILKPFVCPTNQISHNRLKSPARITPLSGYSARLVFL